MAEGVELLSSSSSSAEEEDERAAGDEDGALFITEIDSASSESSSGDEGGDGGLFSRREVPKDFNVDQPRGVPLRPTSLLDTRHLVSKREFHKIVNLAVPIFLSQLALFGMGVATNMILGKTDGPTALAAASLATTWMWCTLFLALAPTFGMDTLVSQAFGAKAFRSVGIILQTALLVEGLTCIPVVVLWWTAEPILLALGQDAEVCSMVARYLRVFTLGLFPVAASRALLRYLVNQGLTLPGLVANVASLLVCVVCNLVFVTAAGWGVEGAAMANVIAWWTNLLVMFGLMYWKGLHRRTWPGWTKECWKPSRLRSYLKYGVGGGAMIFLEVIGFEATTVMAGILGAVQLDAHTVCFNFMLLSFSFALGISEGTSARVGNLLGEGRPTAALVASRTSMFIVLANAAVNGLAFVLARKVAGLAYTDDEDVLSFVEQLMPFGALLTFLDMFQALLGGIMRGAGRATMASVVNGLGYYVIGIPLQAVFAFVLGWGVLGLWRGMGVGLTVIFVGYVSLYLRLDLRHESENAIARSLDEEQEVPMDSLSGESGED
jgi:putative MATE family efflux protein